MIKVDKVLNWRQSWDWKKMYYVSYQNTSDASIFGGFTAYIEDENLPKKNQLFEDVEALEEFCRGVKNEKKNML